MTEPTPNSRSSMRTVQFCKRCGKPMGNQGVSSLTSWLFQETFCQCQLQESPSRDKGSDLKAGSLFGGSPGDRDVFDLPSFGDEYEVLERIGRGGMGCVYKVRDVNLDRFLAVKVLHDQLKNDQQSVSRFEREAKAALKLMHANLVPVFAFGSSPAGAPYLVMDFVDGISLESKLKNESYLDVSIAIDLFLQICNALTHAHQHGIIHRDLKPGNIIITKDDSGKEIAKLVDFGIAKVRSGSSRETQNLTQTGEVFGSPHYMSPEQCLGFDLDSRSDIYSLGCVMYECLSGKTPFEGHNAVQLVAKHLSSDVPPLRICDTSQSPSLNARVTAIITKCLEKEPSDRYFSAELLASELKQLTEQVSSGSVASFGLPRKLSILRIAFIAFCLASIASIVLVGAPLPPESLVISPAVAAVIGAVLINGRINEFVSRTQFQSKLIRESAGGCVNVLVVCHWVLAICASTALLSPFLHMMPQAYPICSATLGTVIGVTVWSGFLQNVESSDIKGSILSGKVMNAISIVMLSTTIYFISQYFGQSPSQSNSQSVWPIETKMVRLAAPRVIESRAGQDPSDVVIQAFDETVETTSARLSITTEVRNGNKFRVFDIPKNIDLGYFYRLPVSIPGRQIVAEGVVELPLSAAYGLNLSPKAIMDHSNVLARFPPDALYGLSIDSIKSSGAHIDDAIYFVRNWKSLVEFNVNGGNLTDAGLKLLGAHQELRYLHLVDTNVTSTGVSALPPLRLLNMLTLSRVKDCHQVVKALRRSRNLTFLALMYTDLDNNDLKELAQFPNLQNIILTYVDGIDERGIKELSSSENLQTLGLVGSKINAKAFPYIAKLRNLRNLDLGGESSTVEERKMLRRALPNCKITVHTTAP